MSKKNTAIHAAFEKANKIGDLPAAVQLARGAVKGKVLSTTIDEAGDLAALLAGPLQRGSDATVSWERFCAYLFAALAMGVAIGQLVHPDVFKTGGAR